MRSEGRSRRGQPSRSPAVSPGCGLWLPLAPQQLRKSHRGRNLTGGPWVLESQQETFGRLPTPGSAISTQFHGVLRPGVVAPTGLHVPLRSHLRPRSEAPVPLPQCVPSPLSVKPRAHGRAVLSSLPLCRGVFLSLIQKHFPSTRRRRDRAGGKRKSKRTCWLCAPLPPSSRAAWPLPVPVPCKSRREFARGQQRRASAWGSEKQRSGPGRQRHSRAQRQPHWQAGKPLGQR